MTDIVTSIPEASTSAHATDVAFFWVLGISGTIFLALLVLVIVFSIRYRAASRVPRGPLPRLLQREIEIGWTTATVFVAIFIFWFFVGGNALPPREGKDQLEIHVVARQWMWKAEHPSGAREINALHLPVQRTVRLVMTSQDVIHSFFVPAFRLKQDVLPERSTQLVFTPTKTGDFHLFCAEFCGTQHSHMIGEIVVMTPADYEAWQSGQPHSDTQAQQGQALFAGLGCGGCHTTENQAAPPLEGIFGHEVALSDGRRVRVDEDYLRRAIMSPRADTVAGFKPTMPSYAAIIVPTELEGLVAYVKSLTPSASVSPSEAHP
jgi:cytochrome c oxidase subunit 2